MLVCNYTMSCVLNNASLQSYELAQAIECSPVVTVTLLNLGISYELTNNLYKAIEWHTLVKQQS